MAGGRLCSRQEMPSTARSRGINAGASWGAAGLARPRLLPRPVGCYAYLTSLRELGLAGWLVGGMSLGACLPSFLGR